MIVLASILAAAFVLALVFSPRGWQALYSRIAFEPTLATSYGSAGVWLDNDTEIPAEDVYFETARRRKLHGWYFHNPASDVVIQYNHSNAGNVEEWLHIVKRLLRTGASVFIYDYQGFGLSQGKPTISGICRDGLAAYDYLTRVRGIDSRKLVIYGSSIGTGVATYVAHQKPHAGLVLHGGFSSLRQLVTEMLPWTRFIPDFFFFRPRLNSDGLIGKIQGPVTILHGQHDYLIGRSHAERLFAAATSPDKELVILPNSGHMDIFDEKLFDAGVKRVVDKVVARKSA